MRLRLTAIGIPNLPGRSRTIRELLRQAPPSIIAGMLNYGSSSAESMARETGSTWAHYAAGHPPPHRDRALHLTEPATHDHAMPPVERRAQDR